MYVCVYVVVGSKKAACIHVHTYIYTYIYTHVKIYTYILQLSDKIQARVAGGI